MKKLIIFHISIVIVIMFVVCLSYKKGQSNHILITTPGTIEYYHDSNGVTFEINPPIEVKPEDNITIVFADVEDNN